MGIDSLKLKGQVCDDSTISVTLCYLLKLKEMASMFVISRVLNC
jgi:hypothetical protein